MAVDLTNAQPPAGIAGVLPLTLAQLDAHADSLRIWATIVSTREGVEENGGDAEAYAVAVSNALDEFTRTFSKGALSALKDVVNRGI